MAARLGHRPGAAAAGGVRPRGHDRPVPAAGAARGGRAGRSAPGCGSSGRPRRMRSSGAGARSGGASIPAKRGARDDRARRARRSARTRQSAAGRATQAPPPRPGPRHAARRRGSSGASRRDGTPPAAALDAGLDAGLDAVPGVRRGRGRPRRRPRKLGADKAYDHRRCRTECRERSITPRIARHGVERSDRLGRHRWVVERTLAWLARSRRLAIRYERRADIHRAFTSLACSLVCLNQIRRLYQGLLIEAAARPGRDRSSPPSNGLAWFDHRRPLGPIGSARRGRGSMPLTVRRAPLRARGSERDRLPRSRRGSLSDGASSVIGLGRSARVADRTADPAPDGRRRSGRFGSRRSPLLTCDAAWSYGSRCA